MADEALSNELLWLAGETDGHGKHSRKRQASGHKSSKRRKHEMTDSEADESDEVEGPKYPLENKYIDEDDKEKLWNMPEIKREEILSKRAEEMQKAITARNLRAMVNSHGKGGTAVDGQSVSRAAKRKHTTVGHSETRGHAMSNLRKTRAERGTRKKHGDRDSSSPVPKRAASDMEDSSSDDEEGQVPKRGSPSSLDGVQLKGDEGKLTIRDLSMARITRDMLEQHCMASYFEDYVKGGWVRALIGMDKGQNIYRICEVTGLISDHRPDIKIDTYPLGKRLVNQMLELRLAGQTKPFPMSKLSCGSFTDKEFDRLVLQCEVDKVKLPTRAKLMAKRDALQKLENTPRTEAEVAFQLARQRDISGAININDLYSRKSLLGTERKLALQRGEMDIVAQLTNEIAEIEAQVVAMNSATREGPGNLGGGAPKPPPMDIAGRINQRNRMQNLEAERALAIQMIEAKRKRGKGFPVHKAVDLSARVKTVVRTHFDGGSGAPSPAPASPAPTGPVPVAATVEQAAGPPGSRVDTLAHAAIIEDLF